VLWSKEADRTLSHSPLDMLKDSFPLVEVEQLDSKGILSERMYCFTFNITTIFSWEDKSNYFVTLFKTSVLTNCKLQNYRVIKQICSRQSLELLWLHK